MFMQGMYIPLPSNRSLPMQWSYSWKLVNFTPLAAVVDGNFSDGEIVGTAVGSAVGFLIIVGVAALVALCIVRKFSQTVETETHT